MKIKYGIGLFALSIVVIYLFSSFFHGMKAEEPVKTQIEESVKADGTALKENCYYLYEVNGYVVVFLSDQKTPYEYTDILYNALPEILKQEIKNGKYIESDEELYGFLENYSS